MGDGVAHATARALLLALPINFTVLSSVYAVVLLFIANGFPSWQEPLPRAGSFGVTGGWSGGSLAALAGCDAGGQPHVMMFKDVDFATPPKIPSSKLVDIAKLTTNMESARDCCQVHALRLLWTTGPGRSFSIGICLASGRWQPLAFLFRIGQTPSVRRASGAQGVPSTHSMTPNAGLKKAASLTSVCTHGVRSAWARARGAPWHNTHGISMCVRMHGLCTCMACASTAWVRGACVHTQVSLVVNPILYQAWRRNQ